MKECGKQRERICSLQGFQKRGPLNPCVHFCVVNKGQRVEDPLLRLCHTWWDTGSLISPCSSLCVCVLLFPFWGGFSFDGATCGTSVPQPGIQPMASALEAPNLNHREVPMLLILNLSQCVGITDPISLLTCVCKEARPHICTDFLFIPF